jgi:hypothetical protein
LASAVLPGKVKIKEPKQQVAIAVQKIEGFLQ